MFCGARGPRVITRYDRLVDIQPAQQSDAKLGDVLCGIQVSIEAEPTGWAPEVVFLPYPQVPAAGASCAHPGILTIEVCVCHGSGHFENGCERQICADGTFTRKENRSTSSPQ